MITPAAIRKLALELPEAVESSHFDVVDFRVRKKIFATIHPNGKTGVLLRIDADQRMWLAERDPETYQLRGTALQVVFARVKAAEYRDLLEQAWRAIAPKRLVAERGDAGRKAAKPAARDSRAPTRRGTGRKASKAAARDTVTPDRVRELALALPATRQSSHFGGVTDFRIDSRIFATIHKSGTSGVLMWLGDDRIAELARKRPRVFRAAGAGLYVELDRISVAEYRALLVEAYEATKARP